LTVGDPGRPSRHAPGKALETGTSAPSISDL